jgi:hypothetical protein
MSCVAESHLEVRFHCVHTYSSNKGLSKNFSLRGLNYIFAYICDNSEDC